MTIFRANRITTVFKLAISMWLCQQKAYPKSALKCACRFESDCQLPSVQNPEHPVVAQTVVHPEGLTAAIRSASLEPCQLGPSVLPSRLARVACPTVCLDFAELGAPMLFQGVMPADCYTLVFVTKCPTDGRSFNFSAAHQDGYMGFFPPGGELNAYTPAGYANATLTIPATEFHLAVEQGFPEIPGRLLRHGGGMRIGADEQSRLRIFLNAITAGIQDPTNPLSSLLARRSVETALLDLFISALRSGAGHLVPAPNLRTHKRLKHVQQAREFIKGSVSETITSADLKTELGMSARGVEVLFRSSFGITPNAFIRNTRLNSARRELLAASRSPGAVSELALKAGFWHMGHFSANYRTLFGESPMQTLQRMS